MRHCLIALTIALTVILTSSLASAGANPTPTAAAIVQAKLIQPLAAKETHQSKFSRARIPPSERRVRVLDEKPKHDSAGETFYTFAVDSRHGWRDESGKASWSSADVTGCVYPGRGEVFIKRGSAFHPAAAAIGKKTKAAPAATCQAAAQLTKS